MIDQTIAHPFNRGYHNHSNIDSNVNEQMPDRWIDATCFEVSNLKVFIGLDTAHRFG
jgi:hypothetical protein